MSDFIFGSLTIMPLAGILTGNNTPPATHRTAPCEGLLIFVVVKIALNNGKCYY
jgi:hypothetical protein